MQQQTVAPTLPKESDSCFRLNGAGVLLFSVVDFLRLNNFVDEPERRAFVIDEFRKQFPDIPILEEWN